MALYLQMTLHSAWNAYPGCSGKKAVHHSWAVASDISTAMHLIQWNTRLTDMRWKANANWMCWIVI